MKYSRITLYVDLLFCLVIIPLVITLLPVDRWIVNNTEFLLALIAYVYGLYFIYRQINLPKLFMRKKYWKIILLMGVLVVLTELFTRFPILPEHLVTDDKAVRIFTNTRTQTIWFLFFVITGFSLAIELTFELFRQILSKHEIAAEKDKAELALYKAQINPHFLFNTLNTLYALVISGSENAESAFVKFSNLLRYMYTQIHTELIPIEKEMEYLQQYVDLQKLRLNHHTKVNFSIDIDNEKSLIAPMIFITFVENAFKYGTSSEQDSVVNISVLLHEGLLEFKTENNIMRRAKDNTTGVGIANCKKRLGLLYSERFSLDIDQEASLFKAHLTIQLQ